MLQEQESKCNVLAVLCCKDLTDKRLAGLTMPCLVRGTEAGIAALD